MINMTRHTRCLGVVFVGLLMTSACKIGSDGAAPTQPDARPDAAPLCEPAIATVGDGHHFPGENCLACHDAELSDGAPEFTVGGTLYNGPSGNKPVANAAIIIVDADNRRFVLPSQLNGNFFSAAKMALPLKVSASQCPQTRPMNAPSVGNCNASGCHAKADPAGRVYLQFP